MKTQTKDGTARPEALAGRHSPDLHALTGGNPYFVMELLRSDEDSVSRTLRNVLLARFNGLPVAAKELAELVSIVPDRAERILVEELGYGWDEAISPCVEHGLIVCSDVHIKYRHELARQIIEDATPLPKRQTLHARVLAKLLESAHASTMLARIVHHAEAAGDAVAIRRYAPVAADIAARHGAHRQSVAFYQKALRLAADLTIAERASLLERYSAECALSGGGDKALAANQEAFGLWRETGNTLQEGVNRLARFELLHTSLYRRDDESLLRLAREALRLLEAHGPSGELAKACINLAFVLSIHDEFDEAEKWHQRAVEVAEAVRDSEAIGYVLIRGELRKHGFYAEPSIEAASRVLKIALEHRDDRTAGQAYFYSAMFAFSSFQLDPAERSVEEGLAFAEARDLDTVKIQLLALHARIKLARGHWLAAEKAANEVLSSRDPPAIARSMVNQVLGCFYARKGDVRGSEYLNKAFELSASQVATRVSRLNTLVRIAELLWLEGKADRAQTEVRRALEDARFMKRHPWVYAQVAFWNWRVCGNSPDVEGGQTPFDLQRAGHWRSAATAWGRLGFPYERALALADGGAAARRQAVTILTQLEACATLRRLESSVFRAGSDQPVLRGPRSTTLNNRFGLTQRESQILALLSQGLANIEIAARLKRSNKTIEHHVSSILSKLGARNRLEAVRIAGSLERSTTDAG
jgi:ATP/maltotriose-dependent transcriptional regulator MalT